MDDKIIKQLKLCLSKNSRISFLVGAGVSADSGIPTFRGKDGYWTVGSVNYKAQEIGTFEMFSKASMEVWKWFLYRKSITTKAAPNAGHFALYDIEQMIGDNFALISQNVDSLHKKAGNSLQRTYLIHGDFDYVRCGDNCSSDIYPFPPEINLENRDKNVITEKEWEALRCPKCNEDLRPHVLWFDERYNERYFKLDTVLKISKHSGILFVLGTTLATNLPEKIVRNVLSKNGMVVYVNVDEYEGFLEKMKNALIIQQDSTSFLIELKDIIKQII
ncbi:hypothetical protein LJC28_04670 [Dysgonomonas sp. OttesenSCG-928-D17]|nr:hypothetical protein [Dysgonomonas sp. OttesenSCG-928-D17]